MASTFENDYASGVINMPEAQGAEIVSARLPYTLLVAAVSLDVFHLGFLPAGHTMVDCEIDSDDLDTNGSPTIDVECGILNAAKDDIDATASGGAAWTGTDDTVAQAAVGLSRAVGRAIKRVVVDANNDQAIGIHVTTVPATGVVGEIALNVRYRALQNGA
jgi:hypothetical protein